MPRRRRDEDESADYSDDDRDQSEGEEDSEDDGGRGRRRGGKQAGRKDAGALQKMKMPELSNTQMKRKIFKKLGYEQPEADKKVPDEIFQFLWKVSQNEQNTFLK
jgi:hypothetical protein